MSEGNSQPAYHKQHRDQFWCIEQGNWGRQKKTTTLGDGGRAIGTTGVSHCVGVYIELEDEYLCWHIECVPMDDFEFVDQVGHADFKKVSKVVKDKLSNEVGSPSVREVQETLIIISSAPRDGSMAMIDGVLQWAGMKTGADQAAFRQTERYNTKAHGFIVEKPGDMTSVKWLIYEQGMKFWDSYWEPVACGEADGMPAIKSAREESLSKQEGDEGESGVPEKGTGALTED